jgi:glutathionylspermidine synthase
VSGRPAPLRLRPTRARDRRARERLFARLDARWPGTVPDPWELVDLHAIDDAEVSAITEAATAICRVYARVAELLAKCPDEVYRRLGLPPAVHRSTRTKIPGLADVVLGRLDLARTPRGYTLLELNADVPGMFVESFAVNRQVCEAAGERDVNEGRESALARGLETAIGASLNHLGIVLGRGRAHVTVAAARASSRDTDLARYLAGLVELPQAVSMRPSTLEELQADETGLFDAEGTRIDVLVRLYPLAAFPYTRLPAVGQPGRSTWMRVLDLVEQRRLVLINPPSAYLLNSKAVQAIIWNLHRSGEYFDATEHALVDRHLLPTYLDPVFGDRPHVVKPACGRGGDTVRVVNAGHAPSRSAGSTYADQPMVYQEYVPLPQIRCMTEDGPRDLHVVASCFIVNGEPAGVCFRAGGVVTDESAWYLPVCATSPHA